MGNVIPGCVARATVAERRADMARVRIGIVWRGNKLGLVRKIERTFATVIGSYLSHFVVEAWAVLKSIGRSFDRCFEELNYAEN